MGGACSTYESDEKWKQNFSRETRREEAVWEIQAYMKDNIKTDLQEIRV
jgi:hypothetical protein